jgi:hypothetical protein
VNTLQSRCGAWLRWARDAKGLQFDLIMIGSDKRDLAKHLLNLDAPLDVIGPTDPWDAGAAMPNSFRRWAPDAECAVQIGELTQLSRESWAKSVR